MKGAFKIRFYYDLRMERPPNQKTIATEKSLLDSQMPRWGTPHTLGGLSSRISQEAEGEGKIVSKRISCDFYRKEWAWHGKQT